MNLRSFIALPIPKETANQLGDLAAKMSYQDKSSAVRWVDQENYHITLAFLGEQDEADLESLVDALDYAIEESEFEICLSHISPFPASKPKLLAAMAEKSQTLIDIHQQVGNAVRNQSMRMDKRKFFPHVTLGRLRHSKNIFAGNIAKSDPLTFWCEEIVLYESILSHSGATYEPICRFPLSMPAYDEDLRSA